MLRLLWLLFQIPMSSPQMTRMLGFVDCAKAALGPSTPVATRLNSDSMHTIMGSPSDREWVIPQLTLG